MSLFTHQTTTGSRVENGAESPGSVRVGLDVGGRSAGDIRSSWLPIGHPTASRPPSTSHSLVRSAASATTARTPEHVSRHMTRLSCNLHAAFGQSSGLAPVELARLPVMESHRLGVYCLTNTRTAPTLPRLAEADSRIVKLGTGRHRWLVTPQLRGMSRLLPPLERAENRPHWTC